MRTELITIAGFELKCTIDAGERWVNVPDIESLLRWRPNSGREKLSSKSLKTFAGKALSVGKKEADHGGTLTMLTTDGRSCQ